MPAFAIDSALHNSEKALIEDIRERGMMEI
jgi:hypothetical protein